MLRSTRKYQEGVIILETLIAILIFSLGVLVMISLQGAAISAQSDAMYRTQAANLVNQIIGRINLGVNRTNSTTLQTTLANFSHQPGGACTASSCSFTGAASAETSVTDFVTSAQTLPGADTSMQQILLGANNSVTVTVGWKVSANAPFRWHQVIAYIN